MGIQDPSLESKYDCKDSLLATANLTQAIIDQLPQYVEDKATQATVMKDIKRRKDQRWKERRQSILDGLNKDQHLTLELCSEKGASTVLNSLPLKRYGFGLNRRQFIDSLCLRYNLTLDDVPETCACGSPNSINHSLSCKLGGYPYLRHDSLKETLAEIL